jgi:periplasmic protein TonB
MTDELMQGERGEFEMLLDEVLGTMANPEIGDGLKGKVMLRLRMAEAEAEAAVEIPRLKIETWGTRSGAGMFEVPRERKNVAPAWLAMGAHAAAILLVTFLMARSVRIVDSVRVASVMTLDTPPPMALPKRLAMGGGGGQPGAAPVSKGAPPRFSPEQLLAPKVPVMDAKLAVEPTIDVDARLKMPDDIATIGITKAPMVGVSMGNGRGAGLGSGNGNGMGPGAGGNTGGGVREVGGSVSAPVEIFKVDPEFSDEARRAKLSGSVLVNLWVDQNGRPAHVRVLQGLGMGLDEKAIDAVRQFRFKPAMENGKPVTVELNVEVSFHIY